MFMRRALYTTAALLLANLPAYAHHGFDTDSIDERLAVADGLLLIEWRGEFSDPQKIKLRQWLTSTATTVSLLHGQLPIEEIRIVLQPYPARSAVPFARILRNNPQGVLFYINPDKALNEFITDWTAYHELSHLFIPWPGKRDIWLSEGLASYYQNILQFRAGLLSEEQTLAKLRAGFERGFADNRNSDLTLAELSPQMREQHAFMRVYWSGAVYFLEADLELHSRGTSLDSILRAFGECCLAEQRDWNGEQLVAQFDELTGGEPLFMPLYQKYAASAGLPDYEKLLTAPGISDILHAEPRQ